MKAAEPAINKTIDKRKTSGPQPATKHPETAEQYRILYNDTKSQAFRTPSSAVDAPLPFYGKDCHALRKAGAHSPLSNFHVGLRPLVYVCENGEPKQFAHGEGLFHYLKADLFNDEGKKQEILEASQHNESALMTKRLGRQVGNFNEATWKVARLRIMQAVLRVKFSRTTQPELFTFLLDTGERTLVEAAPRDKVWGVGCGRDRVLGTPRDQLHTLPGENLLGKALMETREWCRAGCP